MLMTIDTDASVQRPVVNEAAWHVCMWHDMLQVQVMQSSTIRPEAPQTPHEIRATMDVSGKQLTHRSPSLPCQVH